MPSPPTTPLTVRLACEVLRLVQFQLDPDAWIGFKEVLPDVFSNDPEQRDAAVDAIEEIMSASKGGMLTLDEAKALRAKQFGALLLTARSRDGVRMTQSQLAKATGVPQSHISRLERGQHFPTQRTIHRMATALQVSPTFFDPVTPCELA